MGLLKRNGIFYLEYKDGTKHKRMSLKTRNKELAQKMYDNYLLSKITNKILNPNPTLQENQIIHTPVSEKKRKSLLISFTEYLDLCTSQNLSQGVIHAKKRLYELLKNNKITYLDEINQKLLNHIVNDHQKDMANHHIKNLKAFLNFCIKKRYYTREDFESLTFIKQKESIRDITINENDYQKLIKNCYDTDFKLYMMTLWETGCRPNEIINLKKSDINFERGTTKLYQNKTKKYKTAYLTDNLINIFKDIQTEYVFMGYSKNSSYYSIQFRKLRDELNLNKDYCLYAFRHSFGTRMLNKTKDIHLVSKLLGHSDISITAKHYINRSDSEIREKLMSN
ncbi:MAG: tyrosine-type recombinase/integrase [Brevinemataceae bacterium]